MKQNPTFIIGEIVGFHYFKQDLKHFSELFIWDLDKTYLDTKIDSITGIWQAIIERSFSKKNIPATNTLIQLLQKQYQKQKGISSFPLFFITASPPQMEERIREKLEFDRIKSLGCYFKNNLINLKPGYWKRLNRHIGYKLSALLHLRSLLGEHTQQTLWGDDSESDAIIYNLYSDICARRISDEDLIEVLKKFFVTPETISLIQEISKSLPHNDPVRKIYINLAIDTDPEYYLKFGRRTIPTYNSFQLALDLFQDQKLSLDDIFLIYEEMITQYSFTKEELIRSLLDFIKRGRIHDEIEKMILEEFSKRYQLKLKTTEQFKQPAFIDPWIVDKIDYINEYR